MSDPLKDPPITLLVKLGSIAVHADEFTGLGGHEFDRTVIRQLLADQEVAEWIDAMIGLAMLPVKREEK
jgi:hypothetical protein